MCCIWQHPPWQPSNTHSRGTSSLPMMSVSLALLMFARQERKRRTASCVLQVTADTCCGCTKEIFTIKHTEIVGDKILWISRSVTTERPMQVKVVKVKKSDKGDFYKRQQTWELRDLTEVDAKDASKVRRIKMCLFFWQMYFVPYSCTLCRKILNLTSTLRRCIGG